MKSLIEEALSNQSVPQPVAETSEPAKPLSEDDELRRIVEAIHVRISIVGCGGGGSNTVNRLSKTGVFGADLIAANTDAKHLIGVHASHKILLGRNTTRGLGAGAIPEIGEKAAQESHDEIAHLIEHSKIVFVTAGMGGGTGTGSAPYVANLSQKNGALTLGIITMPFKSEGRMRMENARRGLEKLTPHCDTVAVIFNDRLLELVPKLPLNAAFRVADEVLMESIKGLTETITKPGLVNIDFNDVLTVMKDAGIALIGMGEGHSKDDGSERMEKAVGRAIDSPLLGNIDIKSAKGALIRVTGGEDMTVQEAEKAAEIVSASISPRARLIWGCNVEPAMKGVVRVMLVLTGIENSEIFGKENAKGPGSIDSVG